MSAVALFPAESDTSRHIAAALTTSASGVRQREPSWTFGARLFRLAVASPLGFGPGTAAETGVGSTSPAICRNFFAAAL